ncbi:MAG TPA: YibE/F family protein [Negativicutes bacterium]|nr:YibE/F family protein [Negativicutes bacterium]
MMRKTALILWMALIVMAGFLWLSSVVDAKTPSSTDDIPKIQYFKGVVLSEEPMEVDPARAKRGLAATLIKARVTSGPDAGQEVVIINRTMDRSFYNIMAKPGDNVILALMVDPTGKMTYNIADYERSSGLLWLAGLFIVMLILFGRGVGLRAVFVIGTSLVILYYGFVGQVLAGGINVLLLTFIVAILISAITLFSVSGGREPKTWAAFIGTLGGVAAAGLLAGATIKLMHLTGLSSEESMILKATVLKHVDFQGILFAGVVLGALGAVMDVAISIASAQQEVARNCGTLSRRELFASGMAVGRDVMATDANTLILAYAGSSLPLVLLIASQPDLSMLRIFNLDLLVTEFVRALVGSVGLVLSIPLTAAAGAFLLVRQGNQE